MDTQEERDKALDRNLSGVATLLAGAFVAVAGIGTTFGLSQEALLVAINNKVWLYILVAISALVAIGMSVWSLFQGRDRRGNRKQSWILGFGVAFYLAALLLAIWGVADTATGNGRPSLTEVSVKPNSMVDVSFIVHADGVKKGSVIIVEVHGFKDKTVVGNDPLYRSLMRPDDTGDVHQKVTFAYKRMNDVNRLTIRTRPDHEGVDGPDCDASQATDKLGCATVLLP